MDSITWIILIAIVITFGAIALYFILDDRNIIYSQENTFKNAKTNFEFQTPIERNEYRVELLLDYFACRGLAYNHPINVTIISPSKQKYESNALNLNQFRANLDSQVNIPITKVKTEQGTFKVNVEITGTFNCIELKKATLKIKK